MRSENHSRTGFQAGSGQVGGQAFRVLRLPADWHEQLVVAVRQTSGPSGECFQSPGDTLGDGTPSVFTEARL